MCNIDELNYRKKALTRAKKILDRITELDDVNARNELISEVRYAVDQLLQVVEIKLETSSGD